MNSRKNEEAMYPGNAESPSDEHDMRLDERPLPTCHAPQDETSDFTHFS